MKYVPKVTRVNKLPKYSPRVLSIRQVEPIVYRKSIAPTSVKPKESVKITPEEFEFKEDENWIDSFEF